MIYLKLSRRCFASGQLKNIDLNINYYKILSVDIGASEAQIKQSFYALAKKYHPDGESKDEEKFKHISSAYEVLGNIDSRRHYDELRVLNTFEKNMKGENTEA